MSINNTKDTINELNEKIKRQQDTINQLERKKDLIDAEVDRLKKEMREKFQVSTIQELEEKLKKIEQEKQIEIEEARAEYTKNEDIINQIKQTLNI